MAQWKWVDARKEAVHRTNDDGTFESRLITDPEVSAWIADGNQPDSTDMAASLVSYASAKQWALATGGYTKTIAGVARKFATDNESRGLITGKSVRLGQANPPTSVKWQFEDGFVSITSADFMSAAIAIADFVQATFDTLDAVVSAISTGSISNIAEIDAAAWPQNHD